LLLKVKKLLDLFFPIMNNFLNLSAKTSLKLHIKILVKIINIHQLVKRNRIEVLSSKTNHLLKLTLVLINIKNWLLNLSYFLINSFLSLHKIPIEMFKLVKLLPLFLAIFLYFLVKNFLEIFMRTFIRKPFDILL
jgi:hypothetical protein